jgi:hypothetical protein
MDIFRNRSFRGELAAALAFTFTFTLIFTTAALAGKV